MIIMIGSKNPNKIQAVTDAFCMFEPFRGARFTGVSAPSGVSDQPLGLEETITGAGNRAKNAFNGCDFSVGLESGLVPVPLSRTGYMNLSACAIFDGADLYLGLGPAFELPEAVTRLVTEHKLELDEAILRAGVSTNPRIGYSEGIIGILTQGVITRKDYMTPAVSMAMARLMPERFQRLI
ncbi:inosine/xanthosine triphosphatase [Desulfatiferula olefinivorans]